MRKSRLIAVAIGAALAAPRDAALGLATLVLAALGARWLQSHRS